MLGTNKWQFDDHIHDVDDDDFHHKIEVSSVGTVYRVEMSLHYNVTYS